ncbi:MAG: ABC transporter permease subunit [Clostridiales bacterium]|nr:ABC transporter permease subunit [Clostridiales bacterium]
MIQIFKKELKSYLLNPLGYVFLVVFFCIVSMLFYMYNLEQEVSNFGVVLANLRIALMIFIPAITMNLLVEERRNKTEQLLFSVPVTISDIVIGKFLAATAMLIITIVLTMLYPAMLLIVTPIYIPSLITSYIGFLALGMSLIAICMFISSFMENSIISFIVGLGTIFFIWLGEHLIGVMKIEILSEIVDTLLDTFCLMRKYMEFNGGLLNISTVWYYLTIVVMFVFLTIRQIERRRIG